MLGKKGFVFIDVAIVLTLLGILGMSILIYSERKNFAGDLGSLQQTSISPTPIPLDTKISELAVSADVPSTIVLPDAELSLYQYQENTRKLSCTGEDCRLGTHYGDYVSEGYSCMDNPFYNSQRAPLPHQGSVITDASMEIVTANGYQLVTKAGDYSIYLLKGPNGNCHPYQLRLSFLRWDEGEDISTDASVIDVVDSPIGLDRQYHSWGYGCTNSTFRVVVPDKDMASLVRTVLSVPGAFDIKEIDPSVRWETIADTNLVFLNYFKAHPDSSRPIVLEESMTQDIWNAIRNDFGVLFLKPSLHPETMFVLISEKYVYVPSC